MASGAVPSQTYHAPPIIEAVVQLAYVEPLAQVAHRKLLRRLKRNYANSTATQIVNANVDFVSRDVHFEEQIQERMSSADEADAVLVNSSALTWTRLAPYQSWEPFFERIKTDLIAANEVTGYRKLSRMGVRYVNRLDVPFEETGIARYEDYLAINIELPPSIPVVQNYGWRFERTLSEQNLVAIVQSAAVAPEVPNTAAFLLDIDIVATVDLPTKLDDIFAKLEEMRSVKNDHFELSIREKARASFSA